MQVFTYILYRASLTRIAHFVVSVIVLVNDQSSSPSALSSSSFHTYVCHEFIPMCVMRCLNSEVSMVPLPSLSRVRKARRTYVIIKVVFIVILIMIFSTIIILAMSPIIIIIHRHDYRDCHHRHHLQLLPFQHHLVGSFYCSSCCKTQETQSPLSRLCRTGELYHHQMKHHFLYIHVI